MNLNTSATREVVVYILIFSISYIIAGLISPLVPEFSLADTLDGLAKTISWTNAHFR